MTCVGQTLKSKINGCLFYVQELFLENEKLYYTIIDLATNQKFAISKDWFENGYMQNLEIVGGDYEIKDTNIIS